MSVFSGVTDDHVLTRRGGGAFLTRLQRNLNELLAHLPPGADFATLDAAAGELDAEIAFEKEFAADFSPRLATLDAAADPAVLAATMAGAREVVAAYFARRQAVLPLHRHGTMLVDRATTVALRLAGRWLAESGVGPPPSSWCWMTLGAAGRGEASLTGEYDALLIYAVEAGNDASSVVGFAGRAVKILEQAGLASRRGVTPTSQLWRADADEWWKRLRSAAGEGGDAFELLVRLADLRFMAGDPALAEQMVARVRTILADHQAEFFAMARRTAMMPGGFDFFGRLKVGRVGEQRGLFNLSAAGLEPLVANVRLLAVHHGVSATGTMARIQELLQRGKIDVELAGRLLETCHLFGRYVGNWQAGGCGGRRGDVLVNPEELSAADEHDLKSAVEAVGNLQKIIYSSIASQG